MNGKICKRFLLIGMNLLTSIIHADRIKKGEGAVIVTDTLFDILV